MKKLNSILSISLVLLLISMAFLPIVSANANEARDAQLEKEITYIAEHSKTIYESSTEKIILMENIQGKINFGFLKMDESDSGKVYFSLINLNEMQSLFSEQNFIVSQNINLNNVLESDYVCSDEVASALFDIAAYVGFGSGSYAQSYGNTLTGGVEIYLSPRDADLIVGGAGDILTLMGAAIVAASALNLGVSALPGALLTVLGAAINTYYRFAKNSDGSLNVKTSYLLLSYYCLGLPGVGLFIGVGSYKYFIN